jgi:hypothetical protein
MTVSCAVAANEQNMNARKRSFLIIVSSPFLKSEGELAAIYGIFSLMQKVFKSFS